MASTRDREGGGALFDYQNLIFSYIPIACIPILKIIEIFFVVLLPLSVSFSFHGVVIKVKVFPSVFPIFVTVQIGFFLLIEL